MWSRGVFLFFILCLPWGWASSAESDGSDYQIGVSDALSIEVINVGQTEYSFESRVPQNGVISVPLLGELRVQGYTIQQAEAMLESRFRNGYLKRPEVTIRVTEFRPFYVDGGVESPGAYAFQHGLTVEKAIVLAGGFSEVADEENITVSPESDPNAEQPAELAMLIRPGDVISVGEAYDSDTDSIYLYGAVNSPGVVNYRNGLTVEKAIALAGGFSPRASKKKIKIRRATEEGIKEYKRVKLSAALEPGDIITIGESFF